MENIPIKSNILNQNEQQNQFTTLNENIIPDLNFLNELDDYNPKLSEDLVRIICNEVGLNTPDNRVYKLISIHSQKFLEEVIGNTALSIVSKKNNNKFFEYKELIEVLKEKGISNNKSQFYCDNPNVNMDNTKNK